MKRNRNAISYRVRMWFYRLTKEDFYNFIKEIVNGVSLIIALIIIFFMLFILPAFFY